MPSPTQTSVRDLLDHYETFFLDAYGVLVTGRGPLQGAAPFIELLRTEQKSFSIVTNDASRLPSTCAARYQELGIQIDAHEVLTSGSMITEVFKEEALAGSKTMVLGTDDTRTYVTDGGGHILELKPDESPEVVVVAMKVVTISFDRSKLFSQLLQGHRCGEIPEALCRKSRYHLSQTRGRIWLYWWCCRTPARSRTNRRYPGRNNQFIGLGKPYAPIFNAAKRRHPNGKSVMVGDQLDTDILGANRAAIDSVLMLSGVAPSSYQEGPQPTFILRDLSPEGGL